MHRHRLCCLAGGLVFLAVVAVDALAQVPAGTRWFNFESPHVSPIDMTPDGTLVLAVNTAGNRLEVFANDAGELSRIGAVPVGLDPVSVRVRNNSQAWVVNHVSDSISVVDLSTLRVTDTLYIEDEPADVVFAGVFERAFVSVSQRNEVRVFDPDDLGAPPVVIPIKGEDPRMLLTDGKTVWAAIFHGGNRTTIIDEDVVSSEVNPYPGDQNPPPNVGDQFEPHIADGLPTPPPVGMIVRQDGPGQPWFDDNDMDWSAAVTWGLVDHDIAAIGADSLTVSYIGELMTHNFAMGLGPNGLPTLVGLEAINEVRFEPNINGIFARVRIAEPGGTPTIVDLNPHLAYDTPNIPQEQRDLSIGDPRGVAWTAGGVGLVTGMGSNNVAVIDAAFARTDLIEVGQGPTGIVLDEANARAFVLNKFDGSVTAIDLDTLTVADTVQFFDPTPDFIRVGRPLLYDTHATSGLGHVSCASCHVDARTDLLAWDLGVPEGEVLEYSGNQACDAVFPTLECEPFHPMKGPMTTQTLINIIDQGSFTVDPLHWRGDKNELVDFNVAYTGLQGDDAEPTDEEMDLFEAFLLRTFPMPNPNRNVDNSIPDATINQDYYPGAGNPFVGEDLFINLVLFDSPFTNIQDSCVSCHTNPTGTFGLIVPEGGLNVFDGTGLESQSINVPHLYDQYEKFGFDTASQTNTKGFGFLHDGNADSLRDNYMQRAQFNLFADGAEGDQQRADIEAFVMTFSAPEQHAGFGVQAQLGGDASLPARATAQELLDIATQQAQVGLVVKGAADGLARGWYLDTSGLFQSDRADETATFADLQAIATADNPIVFTLVQRDAAERVGVDFDADGAFDLDEIEGFGDPNNPNIVPLGPCAAADTDQSGTVDSTDLNTVLAQFGTFGVDLAGDIDNNGAVDSGDLNVVLGQFGQTCGG